MNIRQKTFAYIAWGQAIIAMGASLYMSEVLHYTPCILCWYQRICMYPLVVILAVGILRRDKGVPIYVLPLSVTGMMIAFFHLLVQYGVIPDQLAPCTLGVSCTTKYISWFGFITIPFLALTAFTTITICMWLILRFKKGTK